MTPNSTTPNLKHLSRKFQPLRHYIPLVLLVLPFSPAAMAGSANATMAVSMQVLQSCSSLVNKQTASVSCPPDIPFVVTRSQTTKTLPDSTTITVQTVTIRY
jgi:hypothetical protein